MRGPVTLLTAIPGGTPRPAQATVSRYLTEGERRRILQSLDLAAVVAAFVLSLLSTWGKSSSEATREAALTKCIEGPRRRSGTGLPDWRRSR